MAAREEVRLKCHGDTWAPELKSHGVEAHGRPPEQSGKTASRQGAQVTARLE